MPALQARWSHTPRATARRARSRASGRGRSRHASHRRHGRRRVVPRVVAHGSRILYVKDGQVFSAPSGGGPPRQEVPRAAASSRNLVARREKDRVRRRRLTLHPRSKCPSPRDVLQPSMCTWGPRDLIACAAGNVFYLAPGIVFGNVLPNWLVVVSANTGAVTAVTDSSASHQSPRWSRDGRSLLYVSTRLGPPDVFTETLGNDGHATSKSRRLTTGLNVSVLLAFR